ncbi:hypothetical protein VTO73DRAFT_6948 [Trametes versicolor]
MGVLRHGRFPPLGAAHVFKDRPRPFVSLHLRLYPTLLFYHDDWYECPPHGSPHLNFPAMPDILDCPEMAFWPESLHLAGHTTWPEWKRRIRLVCETRDLLGHLDGSTPMPQHQGSTVSEHAEALVEAWKRNDRWLRFLLAWNMTTRGSADIQTEGRTAAEIWSQLCVKNDRRY